MKPMRARGFTLIEMLVALVVLAVFATFAWRATASLVEGEAHLSVEAQRWQRLDALFARIEADARAAVPRPIRIPLGREPAFVGSGTPDGASAFAFTRAGGDAGESGAEGTRIGYRLAGDTLQILYWPRLDRAAGVEPAVYPLAGGVARFEVRYADDDGSFFERWPPDRRNDLPRALAIALTLADGARVERLIVLR
ncbi:MAG: type II secretion system minor pseudopilin GspJ [Betaproteobacteria bacterium]